MRRFSAAGGSGVAALAALVWVCAGLAGIYDLIVIRAAESEYAKARRDLAREAFSPALDHLRRAQSLCPEDAVYWAAEGFLAARWSAPRSILDPGEPAEVRGEEDRARLRSGIRAYRQAVSLAPTDSLLFHNVSWLHVMAGDFGSARQALDRAIALEPREPLYRLSSALWHERNRDSAAAVREYATALALSPALADSLHFQRFARRLPGGYRDAVEMAADQLQREFERTRDPLVGARLARVLWLAGRDAGVRELLENALAQLPSLPKPWVSLGRLRERDGDTEAARLCYRRAVFLNPSEVFGWGRLANRFERSGAGRAWAAYGYQRALRDQPRTPPVIDHRWLYQSAALETGDVAPAGMAEFCAPVHESIGGAQ